MVSQAISYRAELLSVTILDFLKRHAASAPAV